MTTAEKMSQEVAAGWAESRADAPAVDALTKRAFLATERRMRTLSPLVIEA